MRRMVMGCTTPEEPKLLHVKGDFPGVTSLPQSVNRVISPLRHFHMSHKIAWVLCFPIHTSYLILFNEMRFNKPQCHELKFHDDAKSRSSIRVRSGAEQSLMYRRCSIHSSASSVTLYALNTPTLGSAVTRPNVKDIQHNYSGVGEFTL